MASMWRVVCKGGPSRARGERRAVDRGPLHPDRAHAEWHAEFLRGTGLYDTVEVTSAAVPVGGGSSEGGAFGSADPFA